MTGQFSNQEKWQLRDGPLLGHEALPRLLILLTLFYSQLPVWVWSKARRGLEGETGLWWEVSVIENH